MAHRSRECTSQAKGVAWEDQRKLQVAKASKNRPFLGQVDGKLSGTLTSSAQGFSDSHPIRRLTLNTFWTISLPGVRSDLRFEILNKQS